MKTQFRDRFRPRGWGKNGKTGIRQWIPRGIKERRKDKARFREGANLEEIHEISRLELSSEPSINQLSVQSNSESES